MIFEIKPPSKASDGSTLNRNLLRFLCCFCRYFSPVVNELPPMSQGHAPVVILLRLCWKQQHNFDVSSPGNFFSLSSTEQFNNPDKGLCSLENMKDVICNVDEINEISFINVEFLLWVLSRPSCCREMVGETFSFLLQRSTWLRDSQETPMRWKQSVYSKLHEESLFLWQHLIYESLMSTLFLSDKKWKHLSYMKMRNRQTLSVNCEVHEEINVVTHPFNVSWKKINEK